jgi:hypothetical protein
MYFSGNVLCPPPPMTTTYYGTIERSCPHRHFSHPYGGGGGGIGDYTIGPQELSSCGVQLQLPLLQSACNFPVGPTKIQRYVIALIYCAFHAFRSVDSGPYCRAGCPRHPGGTWGRLRIPLCLLWPLHTLPSRVSPSTNRALSEPSGTSRRTSYASPLPMAVKLKSNALG